MMNKVMFSSATASPTSDQSTSDREQRITHLHKRIQEASHGTLINLYDHITDPRATYIPDVDRTLLIEAAHQQAQKNGMSLHVYAPSYEKRVRRAKLGTELEPLFSPEAWNKLAPLPTTLLDSITQSFKALAKRHSPTP